MKKLRILLVLFWPFLLISCFASNQLVTTNSSYVIDGDTFDAANGKRYRLVGIDTPEIYKGENDTNSYTYWQNYFGNKAKQYTETFVEGKINVKELKVDKYNRTVAHVINNEKDLSVELVRLGYAKVMYISLNEKDPFYTNDHEFYKRLLDAQHDAYINKRGIWQDMSIMNEIFPNN